MKNIRIGYPCINRSLASTSAKSFRLASYSHQRFMDTVQRNLSGLYRMLRYNVEHGLLFFRISSDLIPFASHPVCDIDWMAEFKKQLETIGSYIKANNMRISMHPDQFVVLNSPRKEVVASSIAELVYHAQLLDALTLDRTAKMQLHGGGVYGDKVSAIDRFVSVYHELPAHVRDRLVIENDERGYSVNDCIALHERTGIPVLLDTFHHECFPDGLSLSQAFDVVRATWSIDDGPPMLDYSSQHPTKRPGAHAETIDIDHFKHVIKQISGDAADIMIEIKDKELSALQARSIV